jgi:V/A-type H+-transporting ATPase subunit E
MSDTDDISGLENALAERAQKLAAEHLDNGHQARERILSDNRQRLLIEQEREVLAAKAAAERAYQQQVQAAELDLRAELDQLRRELAAAAMAKLPGKLTELATDEARYLPLLRGYLREAAQAIERDRLLVQCNARDRQLLDSDWERHARDAAPGKQLELSPQTLQCIGGVLVASSDGDIRYDNTFEGRMDRLDEILLGTLAERLAVQAGEEAHG